MVGRGLLVLFGGAAGAGKTTLARAWCATRRRAAFVELDAVRDLIVAGRVDPQIVNAEQSRQYEASVFASAALAKAFSGAGFDVAIEEVFGPAEFERLWAPLLEGYDYRIVINHPTLDETLSRSQEREKTVFERHTRDQHATCAAWPARVRVDTTGLDVADSLAAVRAVLDET